MRVLSPPQILSKLLLGLSICLLPPSSYAKPNKRFLSKIDVQFKKLIEINHNEIKSLEKEIGNKLNRGENVVKKIKPLIDKRLDLTLKQHFYYSINGRIQSTYKNEPLRPFLKRQFLDMGEKEALSEKPNFEYIQFLSYISDIVMNAPTSHSQLISYLEGYIRHAGISQAQAPSQYMKNRMYANGLVSKTIKTVSKQQLGDHIDSELKNIDNIEYKLIIAKKRINSSRTRLPKELWKF